MALAISASNMAIETPIQTRLMTSLAALQLAGSALPVIQMAGERCSDVACRNATYWLAAFSPRTSGSSKLTEEMTVGSTSDATIAVIQIQRVPMRFRRAARSARNAPTDSSAETMIT